jgi:hypothetical protein
MASEEGDHLTNAQLSATTELLLEQMFFHDI